MLIDAHYPQTILFCNGFGILNHVFLNPELGSGTCGNHLLMMAGAGSGLNLEQLLLPG